MRFLVLSNRVSFFLSTSSHSNPRFALTIFLIFFPLHSCIAANGPPLTANPIAEGGSPKSNGQIPIVNLEWESSFDAAVTNHSGQSSGSCLEPGYKSSLRCGANGSTPANEDAEGVCSIGDGIDLQIYAPLESISASSPSSAYSNRKRLEKMTMMRRGKRLVSDGDAAQPKTAAVPTTKFTDPSLRKNESSIVPSFRNVLSYLRQSARKCWRMMMKKAAVSLR